jgi:archaemetzincin
MMKNSLFLLLISLFACNSNDNPSKELALIDRLKRLDKPMPKPKMEDWLFDHKEAGQTFEQYQKASPVMPSPNQMPRRTLCVASV